MFVINLVTILAEVFLEGVEPGAPWVMGGPGEGQAWLLGTLWGHSRGKCRVHEGKAQLLQAAPMAGTRSHSWPGFLVLCPCISGFGDARIPNPVATIPQLVPSKETLA